MPDAGQKKPLMLMILDGWGCSPERIGNATVWAKTPNFNRLIDRYPHTLLTASGKEVGLPKGQMGNSEVGHLNIGAGRVVYQELTRIFKDIEDEDFFKNEVLLEAMHRLRGTNHSLHLMGLLSDGGVHSHIEHLNDMLMMAVKEEVERVFIHVFLDGRDVLPQSARDYLCKLITKTEELGKGKIATVIGRYYAMDRDKRWDRVNQAYKAMVYGEGEMAPNALAAIQKCYECKVLDEFVQPTVIIEGNGQPVAKIQDGDSLIFFNFRADRAREITRAFIQEDFKEFERPDRPQVHFVCMTEYDAEFDCPVAYPPQNLDNTLGEVLADNNLRQLRIAETEKYAHVTFFFNGGVEEPNDKEDRVLIPSPKVATYNLKPEMSAYEITDSVLQEIEKNIYDVIILNYANPDMVGHTGYFDATVRAVEAVDICLGKVEEAIRRHGGTLLITADHGNAETMIDQRALSDINSPTTSMVSISFISDKGLYSPMTSHTTNKVPCIIVNEAYKGRILREGAALRDIAPTILEILGIPKPKEMTGKSLLSQNEE
ncbi:phosphoglycerate mutase [Syntrophobotulus glycolicus DSM 8271]|uniref:2,3-bisphosphoglycerate-independent phosphoglycerate mutase n=1 Tax=Syntrophobotulus glycolicus (strain DSM 8271 / FlGlyR) TaxID=645991 RepID=F0T1Q2_SYNGF|nr:2,3-bisphosphoglycerate-independent phosphoglycerate mutase [Syntrophobotulus glycolicus]ADY57476.1 phosphoglycerate mutase [Syntrophobotulus glycolicus DSM 8271]